MVGGVLKLTLFFNVLFLFVALLWQVATADTSSILATDNNLATFNDDVSYSSANNIHEGARLVKRSLDSTVDQESVIGGLRHRRLRKKLHPTKLNKFPTIFQSTGTHRKNLRPSKRFRMLDPDEFQEMLNSLSQQTPDEQPKGFNSMDTIAGMQLENYWSRK